MFRRLFSLALVCSGHVNAQPTILWRVSRPESPDTSYLLGTFHQSGNSFIDSLPAVVQALNGCGLAVFESIDDGEALIRSLKARPDDASCKKHLGQEELDLLRSLSAGWKVPVEKVTPMELLTKLRQEYVKMHCGTIRPGDKWDHMDRYLIHLATARGMALHGLENDSLQTEVINAGAQGAGWEQLTGHIDEAIVDLAKGRRSHRKCAPARDYLCLSLNYQLDVECGLGGMLKGRNETWMSSLPGLLEQQNCFVAVGLLHLYGRCGLIAQLKALGYVVEPVPMRTSKVHCSK